MKTKMLLAMIVFGSFGLISCSEQKPTEQVKPTRQAQATVEDTLDDESKLWEVVEAKLNGRNF